MYKEQIETATAEVKRIEEENKQILNKAGCCSEGELLVKQQKYNENWSLCNTLAERNRSIKADCERIVLEYDDIASKAESSVRSVGTSISEQIEHQAEQKAKVTLQEMYGKDLLE